MAELTLTGATLTSDGPLVEMTSNPASLGGHNHSHSHSHSHSGRPCCSSPTPVHYHPAIPNIPVSEVLTWEDSLVFKRLSEIVRTGTFEDFDPILKGLRGKDRVSSVLNRLGDDGPSLLHWAAKRGM